MLPTEPHAGNQSEPARRGRTNDTPYRDAAGWLAGKHGVVQEFLDIASRLYPEFLSDLVEPAPNVILLKRAGLSDEAKAEINRIVESWQAKYRLAVGWAYHVSWFTIVAAGTAALDGHLLPDRVLWPLSHHIESFNLVGLRIDPELFDPDTPYAPVEVDVDFHGYWAFESEPRADARARLLREAEIRIDQQLDEIEAELVEVGLQSIKDFSPNHFEWLAHLLIGREKAYRIAVRAFPGRSGADTRPNVVRGIRGAAKALGIELPARLSSLSTKK